MNIIDGVGYRLNLFLFPSRVRNKIIILIMSTDDSGMLDVDKIPVDEL